MQAEWSRAAAVGSLQLVSRAVAGTSRKTAIRRLPCRTSDAAGHEGYGAMKSARDGDESGCRVRVFWLAVGMAMHCA